MKSELRLIKNSMEYLEKDNYGVTPKGASGIYVLYKRRGYKNDESHHFDVVYADMARTSIKSRICSHRKHKEAL